MRPPAFDPAMTYPRYDVPFLESWDRRFEAVFVLLHPFVRSASRSEAVTWREVASLSGVDTLGRVCRALLGMIGALKKQYVLPDDISRLARCAESHGLDFPSEGSFQSIHLAPFARLFEALGHSALICQPEFDHHPNHEIQTSELEEFGPYRGSLFDQKRDALVVVDWDSFFTLVAGPRNHLERWVEIERLEGFFAESKTEHDWWLTEAASLK